MKLRLIGDIHGYWGPYLDIINGCENSVQVGDYGIGFPARSILAEDIKKAWEGPEVGPTHRFIRGNHDNPKACKEHPRWIPDGTIENGVMYIGGALSIDKHFRTPGVDYWPDEELSYEQWIPIIQKAIDEKPKIIVAHDCPETIVPYMGNSLPIKSITQQALAGLFSAYQPELYIYGHWHRPLDKIINGTRFICLPINQYIDVDLENLHVQFPYTYRDVEF